MFVCLPSNTRKECRSNLGCGADSFVCHTKLLSGLLHILFEVVIYSSKQFYLSQLLSLYCHIKWLLGYEEEQMQDLEEKMNCVLKEPQEVMR